MKTLLLCAVDFVCTPYRKIVERRKRKEAERRLVFAYLEHISVLLEGISSADNYRIERGIKNDGLFNEARKTRGKIDGLRFALEERNFYGRAK